MTKHAPKRALKVLRPLDQATLDGWARRACSTVDREGHFQNALRRFYGTAERGLARVRTTGAAIEQQRALEKAANAYLAALAAIERPNAFEAAARETDPTFQLDDMKRSPRLVANIADRLAHEIAQLDADGRASHSLTVNAPTGSDQVATFAASLAILLDGGALRFEIGRPLNTGNQKGGSAHRYKGPAYNLFAEILAAVFDPITPSEISEAARLARKNLTDTEGLRRDLTSLDNMHNLEEVERARQALLGIINPQG